MRPVGGRAFVKKRGSNCILERGLIDFGVGKCGGDASEKKIGKRLKCQYM